jgi:hypothetical protein
MESWQRSQRINYASAAARSIGPGSCIALILEPSRRRWIETDKKRKSTPAFSPLMKGPPMRNRMTTYVPGCERLLSQRVGKAGEACEIRLWRTRMDVGILRIWRSSRLEKDADLQTEGSLEKLSSRLLGQGNLVTSSLRVSLWP